MIDKNEIIQNCFTYTDTDDSVTRKYFEASLFLEKESSIDMRVYNSFSRQEKVAYDTKQPVELTKQVFTSVYDEVIIELLTLKEHLKTSLGPEGLKSIDKLIDKLSLKELC